MPNAFYPYNSVQVPNPSFYAHTHIVTGDGTAKNVKLMDATGLNGIWRFRFTWENIPSINTNPPRAIGILMSISEAYPSGNTTDGGTPLWAASGSGSLAMVVPIYVNDSGTISPTVEIKSTTAWTTGTLQIDWRQPDD